MPHSYEPIPGDWYQRHDNGFKFEIVDVDENEGLIDLQYADGSVDQLDREGWGALDIAPSEPSEDLDVEPPAGQ